MSDNDRHVSINSDGATEIPVIVGGRLLYYYTIDASDIRPDMYRMWSSQLKAKRWFTPRLQKEFEQIYSSAL